MHPMHWKLLARLADGEAHHVRTLSPYVGVKPQQLNGLWQQMPAHVRGLLRQNDGYWRLVRPLAVFDETGLQQLAAGFDARLVHECTSSNDLLLADARSENPAVHRRLYVAHSQSKGRGRQGKSWQSRLGECLMFSLGWTFDKAQAELGPLALVCALACQRALQQQGLAAQIKWPNDLVVGGDKLGGILIETVRSGGRTHAVIGIGINYVLPKQVEQATSVQAAFQTGIAPSAATVLQSVLQQLAQLLPQFAESGFAPLLAEYQAVHRDQGRSVSLFKDGKVQFEGRAVGVTAQGALKLQTADGEREVVNGEVSLRPKEKLQTTVAEAKTRYLLLDGGNSQLKWVWVENGVLGPVERAPYRELAPLGEAWRQHGSAADSIIGCAVCGEAKKALVAAQLPKEIVWLPSMPQGLGVRNHYRNPAEHGADRWFNALGSRRFTQNACVVVSCGTAVTVDALTHDDHYLGGTIMPGFHLMKEAMALKTANLNRPIGKVYAFPTTTSNALASGMMDAVCGSILLMHSRLQEKTGEGQPVDVVLTGGGAAKVALNLPQSFILDNTVKIVDNLVLYGLLNWVEQA